MNLRTLFAIPIAVILSVTLSLAAMILGQGWTELVQGKVATEAVEQIRLLLRLEADLRAERVVSNYALGKPYPVPEAVKQRLSGVRRDTDLGIAALNDMFGSTTVAAKRKAPQPGRYLPVVVAKLAAVRTLIDELLVSGQPARTFTVLNGMMPRMFAVAEVLEAPLQHAGVAVIEADPGLSGLMILERLGVSLRDQVGLIAAVWLPKFNAGQLPDAADREQVRLLLARASHLTNLLGDAITIAGTTSQLRTSYDALVAIDLTGMPRRLDEEAAKPAADRDDMTSSTPQRLLVPWGVRINGLRTAIVDATVERVKTSQIARERKFDIILAAFGLMLIAILESVILLSYRVVGPLAQLGLAITRIAAGDRSVQLALHSETNDITKMATAVETLRQAALVADATVLRHRMAARHRLGMLREALGIARAVQEPARALERGVADLSDGIDATIALITTPTTAPPATLRVAATAVRMGLAEMRDSAADLDATFAAACCAQTEDRPEAEFVAHILAMRAQVDRRDIAVRGFVLPSLVGLRDARSATNEGAGPALRDLVSDQFDRLEEAVAMIASMLAAVTRASDIVRDLPLEDMPLAA